MFVTANQIYVFLACVSFGGCTGVLFTASYFIKYAIKRTYLKFIPDVISFVAVGILYVFYSYYACFSNLRIYMLFGIIVGIILYFKSFHIILAKILKKTYNILKRKKVKTNDDGIENKKADSCDNGGCGIVSNGTGVGNALSVNKYKFRKKSTF